MPALTPQEIRTYEEDGYVVPSYRVPEDRMAALAAAAEEVMAANPDTAPGTASQHPHHQRVRHPPQGAPGLSRHRPRRGPARPGLVRHRRRLHHVGVPDLLQARLRRDGGADAPGRPVLAHPAACNVHRVARDRQFGSRERLPHRHPRLASQPGDTSGTRRAPTTTSSSTRRWTTRAPSHDRRRMSSSRAGSSPCTTSTSSTARPRTPRGAAARALRCATCRPLRGSGATSRCSSRGYPSNFKDRPIWLARGATSAAGTTSPSATPPWQRNALPFPRSPEEGKMRFTIETEIEEDGRWIAEIVQLPGRDAIRWE